VVATAGGEMAVLVEGGTLGRAPLDGGPVRAVAEVVKDADWTPAGGEFALVRAIAGRQRLEFPAGKVLHETDGQGEIVGPRLSRSGDRIAFVYRTSYIATPASVAVVDLGGRLTTLSTVWGDIEGLAWSPDGTEVWFTGAKAGSAKALYAVSLSGRERLVQRLPDRLTLYDISRDGRVLLAVERHRGEMQGRLVGDPAERSLSWLDGTGSPVVSSDGRSVAFGEWGEGAGSRASVYLRRSGDPPVRLGEAAVPLDLSADGKWVLAAGEQQPWLLQLLPTGAGEPIVLAPGPVAKVVSAWFFPDGRRIAILGNEAGRPIRLFVQDIEGGTPRPFTPEDTMARGGVFTADGRYMAASPRVSPPAFKLYPVEGGEPLPMPRLGRSDFPKRWDGDRRYMFVRELGNAGVGAPIFRVDVKTGARTLWNTLAPSDPAGVKLISFVSLSSDGQSYAFSFDRTLSDLYLVEGLR
jgi:dipeptidyl aminopeptidase/acylaminoacyl peptidase